MAIAPLNKFLTKAVPVTPSNQQVYEDKEAGRLSGSVNPQTEPKKDGYSEYIIDEVIFIFII